MHREQQQADLKGWEEPRFYEGWLEVAYSGRYIPAQHDIWLTVPWLRCKEDSQ